VLISTPAETVDLSDPETIDAAIAAVPNSPAVFLICPEAGAPYLARTNVLRRRLLRLLGPREQPSRMLHLRSIARRLEYWIFSSRLESSMLLYGLAREHFPEDYARVLKLRQPPYVKLILTNQFPRTQITTRLSGSDSLHVGPFPSRAAAEQLEAGMLDFFQLRRCQEDLEPTPEHPGCVYGEMNKCLRPCQQVVSIEEYASEAGRVAAFLRSSGQSLVESLRTARDRFSEEMEFEEAARLHKRMEKAAAVMQGAGELVRDVARLSGVAVLPSTIPESVLLCFFREGLWVPAACLSLALEQGRPVPLDRRIREVVAAMPEQRRVTVRERQEHLSLLSSWFYSTSRDGEWVIVEDPRSLPYRKLVNAVHRVAKATGAVIR
jgi:excinuclease UvrABC nuclease subunit